MAKDGHKYFMSAHDVQPFFRYQWGAAKHADGFAPSAGITYCKARHPEFVRCLALLSWETLLCYQKLNVFCAI